MDNWKTPAVDLGRAMARGALIEIGGWLFVGSLVIAALSWGASSLGFNWDATDDRAQGEHSEMHLRIDHGTGCQYLESAAGALTPRMSTAGRQVCR